MLDEKHYPLAQVFGAAYTVFTRYHDTKLMDYQQRRLNYYFKQHPNFVNKLEFNADGWSIICHCDKVNIYYKHHDFMEERIIQIIEKPIQKTSNL
jgi:hypothetical protein